MLEHPLLPARSAPAIQEGIALSMKSWEVKARGGVSKSSLKDYTANVDSLKPYSI